MKLSQILHAQSAILTPKSVHALPCPPLRSATALKKAKFYVSRRQNSKVLVRAEDNGEKKKDEGKDNTRQEKLVQDLKRGGVDQETAQRILKVWEETGAESPEGLRKLLVGRSLKTAGIVGLQTLLDAGASYGAATAGASVASGPDFFGKIVVEFLLYFLGIYFGTSVLLDLFTLGAVAFSSFQYTTNSEAFLNAVREVAGPGKSNVNVVQKAKEAVNIGKVVGALNRISGILRERGGEGLTGNAINDLGVYLTLQKAEAAGFKAENYGLTGDQAGIIAAVFSKYDANDDFVLSTYEVNKLFQEEGYNFSEAEMREAIKLLDKNEDKYIQFTEFVDWWQNEVSEEQRQRLEKAVAANNSNKDKEPAAAGKS